MNCTVSHESLWLWAQGEADAASSAQIDAHIRGCDRCQAELREMRGVIADLRLAASRPPATAPARRGAVGPYEIIRELGRGGMGVVYEARQQNPDRRVALKLLAERAGDDPYRARLFRREVQALARLNHPGIAAIYDAGQTDDGHDYYVMELVPGADLARYANGGDGRPMLDLRARLELFRSVCNAVAYAHQRGIIHRDLKPGNILVAVAAAAPAIPGAEDQRNKGVEGRRPGSAPVGDTGLAHGGYIVATDERRSASDRADRRPAPVHPLILNPSAPFPKILDFGLARAIEPDPGSATLRTEAGRIMGTLGYMSPEQALGRPDEIDARTDVYALGVILYELLTASPPYDLSRTTIPQSLRLICEQPPRPPRELNPRIPPDVQTIVLKAIEKDRDSRYSSVDALRGDVERFLTGHPILARPAGAWYRLTKLVMRHRLASALLAALTITVAASLIVALVQARRIAIESERLRIEARTVSSINAVLEGLLESADPWSLGRRDVRVLDVLDGAARRIDADLSDSPLVAAAVHNTLGRTYRAFAEFEKGEKQLHAALQTRRRLLGEDAVESARTMNDLAELHMLAGRPADAEPLLRMALEIRQARLPPSDPEIGTSLNNLGLLLKQRGDADGARLHYEQALRVRRAAVDAADDDESRSHRDRSHARNELAQSLNNMAALSRAQRRLDEAESLYQESLALRLQVLDAGHPDIAKMYNNLGMLLLDKGDAAAAAEHLRMALSMLERGLGAEHVFVAAAGHNLAVALRQTGRPRDGIELARTALETRRKLLGAEHPDTRDSESLLQSLISAGE